jgi:hypothetical protein
MIGKLPKSEAWKQSDPDRSGLLLHPKYSNRDSLCQSLSKLEPRNHVGLQKILLELPRLSYEEGSRLAGRLSGP